MHHSCFLCGAQRLLLSFYVAQRLLLACNYCKFYSFHFGKRFCVLSYLKDFARPLHRLSKQHKPWAELWQLCWEEGWYGVLSAHGSPERVVVPFVFPHHLTSIEAAFLRNKRTRRTGQTETWAANVQKQHCKPALHFWSDICNNTHLDVEPPSSQLLYE